MCILLETNGILHFDGFPPYLRPEWHTFWKLIIKFFLKQRCSLQVNTNPCQDLCNGRVQCTLEYGLLRGP